MISLCDATANQLLTDRRKIMDRATSSASELNGKHVQKKVYKKGDRNGFLFRIGNGYSCALNL